MMLVVLSVLLMEAIHKRRSKTYHLETGDDMRFIAQSAEPSDDAVATVGRIVRHLDHAANLELAANLLRIDRLSPWLLRC